jgi:hypothetical protein
MGEPRLLLRRLEYGGSKVRNLPSFKIPPDDVVVHWGIERGYFSLLAGKLGIYCGVCLGTEDISNATL